MLVVLQYHGVTIGPALFMTNPELAYGPFAAMAVTYILMIFFIVPRQPTPPSEANLREQIIDVGRIYADASFWRLAPMISSASRSRSIRSLTASNSWSRSKRSEIEGRRRI